MQASMLGTSRIHGRIEFPLAPCDIPGIRF